MADEVQRSYTVKIAMQVSEYETVDNITREDIVGFILRQSIKT